MAGENCWDMKPLGDCLSFIIDHRGKTPKKLGSDWVEQGVPTISAKNVNGGRLVAEDSIRHVTHHVYKRWMNTGDVKRGDCMLVSEGATLGECMYWDEEYPIVLGQRLFCLRANTEVLCPRYFYFYMTSHSFQSEVDARSTGTSVPGLRQTEVLKLQVRLPSIEEQRAIGNVLYNLNKKIELNRRMNETLESMARAIFKSWFVDFDPVRAKMDGQQPPGMNPETAALFPDSFEEQDGEMIPKGWAPLPLPDAFDFKEGPGLRNWQYTDEGIRFLNIRCIVGGELEIHKANCISLEEFHEKYEHFALQTDDVVISTSGTLGRLAIVRGDHLPIMLNTSIIRMRGILPFRMCFVWCYLQSAYFLDEMFAMASGSVQLNFGPVHLKRMSVLQPTQEVLELFEGKVEPLIRQVLANRKESQTLANLRDTLLPKLLSGELRVPEAEKQVEEVA
jgi:type I restriction enzyme, S subunit